MTIAPTNATASELAKCLAKLSMLPTKPVVFPPLTVVFAMTLVTGPVPPVPLGPLGSLVEPVAAAAEFAVVPETEYVAVSAPAADGVGRPICTACSDETISVAADSQSMFCVPCWPGRQQK